MTMTLVDSAVGRETVDVVLSLGIPDGAARCFREDYGERVVVVSGVLVLQFDRGGSGSGVVLGGGEFRCWLKG